MNIPVVAIKKEAKVVETLLKHNSGRPIKERGRIRSILLNPVVCTIGAAAGIFGGISALMSGLFCIIVHGLVPGDMAFDHAGTALLIMGVPLLLLGSIFLDEIPNDR